MVSAPEKAASRAPGRSRSAIGPALVTMLIAKLLTLMLGAISYQVLTDTLLATPRDWLAVWNLWDAPHYLDLAQYGYEATGERADWLVFYPLFPWLTRLVALLFNDTLIAAFVVSTIASFVAAALLYRLARLDHDDATANRAVWFLALFPTAYILHIGYTESLFLALVLGAFLAARSERWPLVAILGALACLTRVNGLILVPALAIEPAIQLWRTRRFDPRPLWLAVVPLGFVGYLALNYRVTGDPFAFLAITRERWYKSFAPPWTGIGSMIESLSWRPPFEIWTVVWQQALFIVLLAVAAVAAWRWLRPAYAVWIALNLFIFTSTSFILSVPRYSLILFPLPILLALLARRPLWNSALTACSAMLLAILAVLFLMQRGMAY
jgi:Gpi18-like mannosyltransferase